MRENLIWMLQWYNLIFGLAFAAILLYVFVLSTGMIAGGSDVDHDAGADHDHADGDSNADGGHDTDGAHHHGGLWAMRGMLGLGKVPASVIVLVFLLFWGTSGLVANAYLRANIASNVNWAWVSIAVALVVSVLGTGITARAVARIMPTSQSYATSARELIGSYAEVLFDVGAKAGTVRLTDRYHNTLDFQARAQVGSGPFKRGETVKVLGVIPGSNHLVVGSGASPSDGESKLQPTQ